jgi:osmotically inducible protein OsmC
MPKEDPSMAITRFAEAVWNGDLLSGSGSINYVSSGSFTRLPVTWASRTEAHDGRTSPEELIASAHASCFSMAFSGALARNGTPATRLEVKAVVTFDKTDAGWRITRSDLAVRGVVPGIDAAKFAELADGAKDGCPISQALKGNVELSVEATLAE